MTVLTRRKVVTRFSAELSCNWIVMMLQLFLNSINDVNPAELVVPPGPMV